MFARAACIKHYHAPLRDETRTRRLELTLLRALADADLLHRKVTVSGADMSIVYCVVFLSEGYGILRNSTARLIVTVPPKIAMKKPCARQLAAFTVPTEPPDLTGATSLLSPGDPQTHPTAQTHPPLSELALPAASHIAVVASCDTWSSSACGSRAVVCL